MEAYMRKTLMCLLALTLILFTFIACDDNTSLPNTPKEKEATIDQQFLFQQLYRQSFLNQNVETVGVTLANGAYTFTDVEIDNHDLVGKLNGTFKDTETEISINVSFTDKDKKTSTVSGTIKRNGKEAVITINGEKCLIDNYQVPPYRDKTQPIPTATIQQRTIHSDIITNTHQINTSSTEPEGFTKVEADSFLYENVKILDENGNVKGILSGKTLAGAYCNVTYKGADGVINTVITFFDEPSPDTNIYIFIINGEACTIPL